MPLPSVAARPGGQGLGFLDDSKSAERRRRRKPSPYILVNKVNTSHDQPLASFWGPIYGQWFTGISWPGSAFVRQFLAHTALAPAVAGPQPRYGQLKKHLDRGNFIQNSTRPTGRCWDVSKRTAIGVIKMCAGGWAAAAEQLAARQQVGLRWSWEGDQHWLAWMLRCLGVALAATDIVGCCLHLSSRS